MLQQKAVPKTLVPWEQYRKHAVSDSHCDNQSCQSICLS